MPFVPHHKRELPKKPPGANKKIGVTVLALLSIVISIWAAYSTQRQAQIMTEQDRPWVVATLRPDKLLWIEKETGYVRVYVEAKNVGQTIATGVDAEVSIVLSNEFGSPNGLVLEARNMACAKLNRVTRTADDSGNWIAPSEVQEFRMMGVISEQQVLQMKRQQEEALLATIFVVGCVDYQMPQSLKHFQTGFAYEVFRVDSDDPRKRHEFEIGKELLATELGARKASEGNGYAN